MSEYMETRIWRLETEIEILKSTLAECRAALLREGMERDEFRQERDDLRDELSETRKYVKQLESERNT